MYSENIAFLNHHLPLAITCFDEHARSGRDLSPMFNKALQACSNEHEAAYVIRHLRKALHESAGPSRRLDLWNCVEVLLERLWIREVDSGNLSPTDVPPAIERLANALVAHSKQSTSGPVRSEIKDAAKNEFSAEFHQSLDKNLRSLVPVFVDVERNRIVISDPEVLNAIRTMVDELLTSIAKDEAGDRVKDQLSEMNLDSGGASASAMLELLVEIIRILNLAAFDALYVSGNAAKESLEPLVSTLKKLVPPNLVDVGNRENTNEHLNLHIYVELMNILIACKTSSSINVPLLLSSNLLLEPLKQRLAEQLFCRFRINGFAGSDFDAASMLCKIGGFEEENEVIREMVRRLVTDSLDSDYVSFAIRYVCDLIDIDRVSLRSRWKIWTYLSDAMTNVAEGDWSDMVRCDEDISRSREEMISEIKKSPESGLRLGIEDFHFEDGGYNGIWEFVLYEQKFGCMNTLPAFLRLVKVATDDDLEEQNNISSTRDWNYLWAAEGCIEEGLDSTASRLLEFWLVTTRFEDDSNLFFRPVQVAGRILKLQSLVAKLSVRVDCTQLAKAVDIARQLHISFKGMKSEDHDFVTQELEESHRFLRSRFPSLSSERLSRNRVTTHYRHRLSLLSAGDSERWPPVIVRRFEQIENERDFSLGARRIKDVERESDFPWVVSYHKMLEMPLGRKLGFLSEDPYKDAVEGLINRDFKRHFEPYVALLTLKALSKAGAEYDSLRNELVSRRIDLKLARKFLDDLIEIAKIRNFQAHSMISHAQADRHREWVLGNFQRLIEAFGLTEADFLEFLH